MEYYMSYWVLGSLLGSFIAFIEMKFFAQAQKKIGLPIACFLVPSLTERFKETSASLERKAVLNSLDLLILYYKVGNKFLQTIGRLEK